MQPIESNDLSFYTVPEAAELLRVDAATIYRAIRKKEFPAVKIQGRFIVPTEAIKSLTREALKSHRCIDVANYVLRLREDG